jgi:hypothetical protein
MSPGWQALVLAAHPPMPEFEQRLRQVNVPLAGIGQFEVQI